MNSFSFFFLVNNKNALTFVFLNPLRRWYIPLVFRLVNSISLQSIYTGKKTAGVLVQKRPIISFIILLFIIYLCVCVCAWTVILWAHLLHFFFFISLVSY
jgi:hypothetical protein